ncbi:MAG: DNA gyrase subunit A [Candidatus Moranbacteria bacterium]|nr:DNA gyrase subunit A [Candidatus Moranbacteria bacterium]
MSDYPQQIKPRKIVEEMKSSYLDYAMAIIVGRALPDVRDGLKPSQRRILYSMHKLGLTHSARYRKSALVVGDTLGKYHPHGDIALYETLVRMAQDFSLRYMLVDGQGNFGSVDGDGAAHMRYTECRMQAMAEAMLEDIEKETIDFVDNYDASRKEPSVLPAAVPQLLINGTMGIAVGVATNIPPHNIGEIIDATVHLIDNPECEIKDLMNFIQGPDFPTGGIIYGAEDIAEAYSSGKGRIITRAKCQIVETKKGRGNIIVNQITYQSNKANTIAKIAELVKAGKIQGIRDIRDESDKEGIRIVIELKKDAYPKKTLNQLYQLTDLQKNFGLNMLALEDGIQPKVMNIKEIIEHYLKHRVEVVTRRTKHDLRKAKERAHILEGLKKALDQIDQVIETIRSSRTKQIAHQNLMKKFAFTDRQTEAILEMKLQTLAGLEREKIQDELKQKLALIQQLQALLASDEKIKQAIKKELLSKRDKYADQRRTKVIKGQVKGFSNEDLVPNEEAIIMLSRGGYIKRMNPNTYKVQKRGGVGIMGATTKEDDVIYLITSAETHDNIYFFTDSGKIYVTKAYEIPEGSRQSKGQAIANFLSLNQQEKVTAILCLNNKQKNPLGLEAEKPKYLFMVTKFGKIKKTKLQAFENLRSSGIYAIKLAGQDVLWWVKPTYGDDEIMLVTSQGQSIRFSEKDVRVMGRTASGVRGIKLKKNDFIVGMDTIKKTDNPDQELEIIAITEKGYGKKTSLKRYKKQKRGGSGIKTMRITAKNGPIKHASIVDKKLDQADLIATSKKGTVIRIRANAVPSLGRATQGVKIMRLRSGDELAQAVVI